MWPRASDLTLLCTLTSSSQCSCCRRLAMSSGVSPDSLATRRGDKNRQRSEVRTEQWPKLNQTRPMKSAARVRQPGLNSSYDCMELTPCVVAEILQGLHGSRPSSHGSSQLTESNMPTLRPMKQFPTVCQPEPCGWRRQPV